MVLRRLVRCGSMVVASAVVSGEPVSPTAKILELLSDMQSKAIREGETAQKVYAEFVEWCEDRSRDLFHAERIMKAAIVDLNAAVEKQAAAISSRTARVEELAGAVSSGEAELMAASRHRDKEAKDFGAQEKELVETVSMLKRASEQLDREMKKGTASMLQLENADGVVGAFSAMVQAFLLDNADSARLSAFVQRVSDSQDADAGNEGSPVVDSYKSHSSSTLETLQDLQDKAEEQLGQLRKEEATSRHNYEMLRQSLEDQLKVAKTDMDRTKIDIAEALEEKSKAEGDLRVSGEELKDAVANKAALHHECMSKAQDFEAGSKSRDEELQALAGAKKAIKEAMGGKASLQPSFLQLGAAAASSSARAVRIVRALAKRRGSSRLALLATRLSSAVSSGGPFIKVHGMISDMIAKLQEEADSEASKKAYCDKELAETAAKQGDKADDVQSLTTKLDSSLAKSAKLKEELLGLQKEISSLVRSQAEMDKLRRQEKASFTETSGELEKSLDAVKLALKTLRDYYGSNQGSSGAGASSGVIGLIEVVESDLSKNLAELSSEEETEQANYEETTKENAVEKAAIEKDILHKTREAGELDKAVAELQNDRSSSSEELAAVQEFLTRIQAECTAKPQSFEESRKRRAAEIAGLKQALDLLEEEGAVLLQSKSMHRSAHVALRGSRASFHPYV